MSAAEPLGALAATPEVRLTRCYRFPAAHVLAHPALPEAENRRLYGKCANPNGHGHDYGVEITVAGPVDPRSGAVFAVDALDAIVEREVLSRFRYRLLNDDPLFRDAVPTAENIALAIRDAVSAPVARFGAARVVRVRLIETRRNAFECEGSL